MLFFFKNIDKLLYFLLVLHTLVDACKLLYVMGTTPGSCLITFMYIEEQS